MTIDDFRRAYSLREPNPLIKRHASHFLPLPDEQVTGHLDDQNERTFETISEIPTSKGAAQRSRYLWVITRDGTPYALETCEFARVVDGGKIKHTNLTGGGLAHCGGEIWFLDERTVLLNGYSGRYGPQTEAELMAAARAVASCGWKVKLMGWLADENGPKQIAEHEEDFICL